MANLLLSALVSEQENFFPADVPHRLAGTTKFDGAAASRRVEVRKRRTGEYVISTVTDAGVGTFAFHGLPPQTLADPYIVTCFDDRPTGYGNALVFDRVYQVDDAGMPPQT